MDTINKIMKTVLSLCLSAFIMSATACADTTKINASTDESKIKITPFGELGLDNNVDNLISDVEKVEGDFYAPTASSLNKNNLLFRSDYFVCNVDIEKANIDWVLDLRELYEYEREPTEHVFVFFANLRSETTADGRFLYYWHDDKPMYLLDLADKKIYLVEIPFYYDLQAGLDSIIVTNTDDKKAYEISLDALSVKPYPATEVAAEHTETNTFPPGMVINAEDVLYRGNQYFVYDGETQEFSVVDKKSGNRLNTSRLAIENPNSFYSVTKDEEAVIFECDEGFYIIYDDEVKRFSDGQIAYEDIDSCLYEYVYTQDGTNVYPFKVVLNLFDIEAAVRMPLELDIKNLI